MPGQKITPFLWFDTQAEAAANFYTSIFKNSKILSVSRYGDAGPGPKGSVMVVNFQLAGQEFTAINGGPQFKFSEAFSLVVNCENQQEIDEYWRKLTADGGRESMCVWLKDKFGFSWQVVPTALGKLMSQQDPRKADRVMQALLKMKKLDIATLERAAAEEESTSPPPSGRGTRDEVRSPASD
jgi:predicted 3-demethylubiquinone-9 3-methyltransferase (glyoxalase superfamily)